MNWSRSLALFALVGALAACSTPSHEVVTYPDGRQRTTSSADAAGYCRDKGLGVQIEGKAAGETGVMFRCI